MGPYPVGRQARWKMSCLQKRFGLPLLWQTLLLMMHHPHVIILLCTRPTLVDQAVWRPFCHTHSVNISQIIRWFIQLVVYLVIQWSWYGHWDYQLLDSLGLVVLDTMEHTFWWIGSCISIHIPRTRNSVKSFKWLNRKSRFICRNIPLETWSLC